MRPYLRLAQKLHKVRTNKIKFVVYLNPIVNQISANTKHSEASWKTVYSNTNNDLEEDCAA